MRAKPAAAKGKYLLSVHLASTMGPGVQVDLFNNISTTYDLMNLLLTFGLDRRWRGKASDIVLAGEPKSVLDRRVQCSRG